MSIANITLKNDNIFLTFPSVNVALSFMNLGPESIDLDKMSDLDYKILRQAVCQGELHSDAPLEARGQLVVPTQVVEPAVVHDPSSGTSEPKVDIVAERKCKKLQVVPTSDERTRQQDLVKILNGNVRQVTGRIRTLQDLRDLKFLLDTERRGKKRKVVIKELNNAITLFCDSVTAAVSSEGAPINPSALAAYKIGTAFEVTEDDVQDISITFPEFDSP